MSGSDGPSQAERAENLRPLAERALMSYDLPAPRVELITNDWNCVFRVDDADGGRHVLRVSLPGQRTREQVRGEMLWLDALAGDGEVTVPAPLAAHDGSLTVVADTDGVPEPRTCVVFGWLEGELLAESLTEHNVEALGATTARLHEHSHRFTVPLGTGSWASIEGYLGPVVLFEDEHAGSLASHRASYERVRDATVEAIAGLVLAERPRMMHADLHQENVLVAPDGALAVLDFDDCVVGWPVQDLGVTLFSLASAGDFERLEAALRRGYEQVLHWPERMPGEARVFAAARGLMLANYLLQDHDPEYRVRAPELIARWGERIDLLMRVTGSA